MMEDFTSIFAEAEQHAADILNSDPLLSAWGLSVVPESHLDAEWEIKHNLARQGVAGVIMA